MILENLDLLDELREEILANLNEARYGLFWFVNSITEDDGVRPFAWSSMSRPIPERDPFLRRPFQLYCALNHVHKSLIEGSKEIGSDGQQTTKTLEAYLQEVCRKLKPTKETSYTIRFLADQEFGTLSVFSAASVLRADVFPEVFISTPAYAAGHLLICMLRRLARQASGNPVREIRRRSPSLQWAAKAVSSTLTYTNLVRERARLYGEISRELSRALKVQQNLLQLRKIFEEGKSSLEAVEWSEHAYFAALQVSLARLSHRCTQLDTVVGPTKQLYTDWIENLEASKSRLWDVTTQDSRSFDERRKTNPLWPGSKLKKSIAAGLKNLKLRRESYVATSDFAEKLSKCSRDVYNEAETILSAGKRDRLLNNYSNINDALIDAGGKLETALTSLEDLLKSKKFKNDFENKNASRPLVPSIENSLSFQFLRELSSILVGKRLDKLKELLALYSLPVERQSRDRRENLDFLLSKLQSSRVAKRTLNWWKIFRDCHKYTKPSDAQDNLDSLDWIDLRDRSRSIAENLLECLKKETGNTRKAGLDPTRLTNVSTAFKKAQLETRKVADAMEELLQGQTSWCSRRGGELLLRLRNSSGTVDALELISALAISYSLGNSDALELEEQIFEELVRLQRSDGGFHAVSPLIRWPYPYYAPSATTILALSHHIFQRLKSRENITDRLVEIWTTILVKSARFILDSFVCNRQKQNQLCGWHSDRSVEPERIDCFATVESTKSLCVIRDALRLLINHKVLRSVDPDRKTYPKPELHKAIPTMCPRERTETEQTILPQMIDVIIGRSRKNKGKTAITPTGSKDCSFIFYGPPGTGKTYTPSIVAGELGWPVVTITLGDFLAEGRDKLIATAKSLFARLSHLTDCCFIFDEFDPMVPKRLSGQERDESSNFLTGAMLPLLSDFWKTVRRQNCLVFFTTNYPETMDEAARRIGRVDHEFMVTYADFGSRLILLANELEKSHMTDLSDHAEDVITLARNTALCAHIPIFNSWKQLCEALKFDRKNNEQNPKPNQTQAALKFFPKPTYAPGFYSGDEDSTLAALDRLYRSIGPDPRKWREGLLLGDWDVFIEKLESYVNSGHKTCAPSKEINSTKV